MSSDTSETMAGLVPPEPRSEQRAHVEYVLPQTVDLAQLLQRLATAVEQQGRRVRGICPLCNRPAYESEIDSTEYYHGITTYTDVDRVYQDTQAHVIWLRTGDVVHHACLVQWSPAHQYNYDAQTLPKSPRAQDREERVERLLTRLVEGVERIAQELHVEPTPTPPPPATAKRRRWLPWRSR